jgi:sodium pump decarboxylase gamma subunit
MQELPFDELWRTNMKNLKRIAIFMVALIVLCTVMSVTAVAASASSEGEAVESGKLDMNLKPESFEERLEYALQGTATGMLMIFGVLGLLTLILYGSKYVFYDMPSKAKNKEKTVKNEVKVEAAPAPVETPAVPAAQDDGELAAVITAAIAAMLESDEYKNEFVGGFRVVSFKRSSQGAWNRK